MFRVAALIVLITVHMIDGRSVQINPKQIVSLVHTRPDGSPNKQIAGKVSCVISFADGKFLSVDETCDQVRKLIDEPP